jgi:hypothetical protein
LKEAGGINISMLQNHLNKLEKNPNDETSMNVIKTLTKDRSEGITKAMNDIVGYQNLIAKIDAVLGAEIGGTGGSKEMKDLSVDISDRVKNPTINGLDNAASIAYNPTIKK